MFDRTYSINVRDFIDGPKMIAEFSSVRLFLKFYYAYKERLKEGESIEAFIGDKYVIVNARPGFVDSFLASLAHRDGRSTL